MYMNKREKEGKKIHEKKKVEKNRIFSAYQHGLQVS